MQCWLCKRELRPGEPVCEYKDHGVCDSCWEAAFKADMLKLDKEASDG